MSTLTLVIPAPCKPINSNHRLNTYVKAERTRLWRARAQVAAIQAGKPRFERAHVRAIVGYPTAKACLDGIVSAGCLADDSNDYVVGPDMREGDKAKTFTLTITLNPDCECLDCSHRFGPRLRLITKGASH